MARLGAEQLRELGEIVGRGSRLASDLGIPFVGGFGSIFNSMLNLASVNAYETDPEQIIAELRQLAAKAAAEEQAAIDDGKAALSRAREEGR